MAIKNSNFPKLASWFQDSAQQVKTPSVATEV